MIQMQSIFRATMGGVLRVVGLVSMGWIAGGECDGASVKYGFAGGTYAPVIEDGEGLLEAAGNLSSHTAVNEGIHAISGGTNREPGSGDRGSSSITFSSGATDGAGLRRVFLPGAPGDIGLATESLVAKAEYLAFTVTPSGEAKLQAIAFDLAKPNVNQRRGFSVRYNALGGDFDANSVEAGWAYVDAGAGGSHEYVHVTMMVAGTAVVTGPVEFRIYGINSANSERSIQTSP